VITGEPGAGKLARRVRGGADGKGPACGHLAGGLLHPLRPPPAGRQASRTAAHRLGPPARPLRRPLQEAVLRTLPHPGHRLGALPGPPHGHAHGGRRRSGGRPCPRCLPPLPARGEVGHGPALAPASAPARQPPRRQPAPGRRSRRHPLPQGRPQGERRRQLPGPHPALAVSAPSSPTAGT
jgi:hypothetical protein